MKDCILWEEPHIGAEEDHEEKGGGEMKHYKLTTIPIPPYMLGGEEVKLGMSLSLRRMEGWGEGCFVFISCSPALV